MSDLFRNEYPRPQFKRSNWINLNGLWDFCIDNTQIGEEEKYYNKTNFEHQINVPFCPESKLSGLEFKDFMFGVWYTRTIEIPEEWIKNHRHTFINIGACDYITKVYVNGNEVGLHRGGYVSFSFEITDHITVGENRITIYAKDDTRSDSVPSGKQSYKYNSFGCFYTRTTGIWQTVWLENTPEAYIKSVKVTPCVKNNQIFIDANVYSKERKPFKATTYFDKKIVGQSKCYITSNNLKLTIDLSEQHLWDVDNPNLYDIEFSFDEDHVKSYFGLREIEFYNGKTYLNGKSIYQRLILDQGFYPDGIYTAPSDQALINDIKISKAMGFNGARLHEKVFEERFLYHADKLGYLIWAEYPNWGLDVSKESCYKNLLPEWLEEIERDYNHPSIIGWCPLNETNCNIDPEFVRYLFKLTKSLDSTRLFIDSSGWHHIKGSYDIYDVHDYSDNPDKFRAKYEALANGEVIEHLDGDTDGSLISNTTNEASFVSEFGGIRYVLNDDGNNWGYGEQVKNEEEFINRFKGLVDVLLDNPKISAFCYTQLTDVEQEQNGLYTYDRKAKFETEKIKKIISRKAYIEQ